MKFQSVMNWMSVHAVRKIGIRYRTILARLTKILICIFWIDLKMYFLRMKIIPLMTFHLKHQINLSSEMIQHPMS